MSYFADKQVIDTRTQGHTATSRLTKTMPKLYIHDISQYTDKYSMSIYILTRQCGIQTE